MPLVVSVLVKVLLCIAGDTSTHVLYNQFATENHHSGMIISDNNHLSHTAKSAPAMNVWFCRQNVRHEHVLLHLQYTFAENKFCGLTKMWFMGNTALSAPEKSQHWSRAWKTSTASRSYDCDALLLFTSCLEFCMVIHVFGQLPSSASSPHFYTGCTNPTTTIVCKKIRIQNKGFSVGLGNITDQQNLGTVSFWFSTIFSSKLSKFFIVLWWMWRFRLSIPTAEDRNEQGCNHLMCLIGNCKTRREIEHISVIFRWHRPLCHASGLSISWSQNDLLVT